MPSFHQICCAIGCLTLAVISCRRTEELPVAGNLSDFQPLQLGSSITYRLDSTVYLSLQTVKTMRSYMIRIKVEALVTDNLGRTAYRMVRQLRDPIDTTRWTPDQAFLTIPTDGKLEWIEQNRRVILMNAPVRAGFNWKGNRHINTVSDPLQQYLDDWDFTWTNTGLPFTSGSRRFPETVTVEMRNDSINDASDNRKYHMRNLAKDVFARGIGLIFRDRLYEVWQPPNSSSTTGYYEPISYGIRLTYLSHTVSP